MSPGAVRLWHGPSQTPSQHHALLYMAVLQGGPQVDSSSGQREGELRGSGRSLSPLTRTISPRAPGGSARRSQSSVQPAGAQRVPSAPRHELQRCAAAAGAAGRSAAGAAPRCQRQRGRRRARGWGRRLAVHPAHHDLLRLPGRGAHPGLHPLAEAGVQARPLPPLHRARLGPRRPGPDGRGGRPGRGAAAAVTPAERSGERSDLRTATGRPRPRLGSHPRLSSTPRPAPGGGTTDGGAAAL